MSETLLGCPFCGAPGRLVGGHRDHWRAQCSSCEATTGGYFAREGAQGKAIAAWNRRTPSLPASAEGGEAIPAIVSRLGWEDTPEHGRQFTATVVYDAPPKLSFDVVWERQPVVLLTLDDFRAALKAETSR